jgi:hypothetical protein
VKHHLQQQITEFVAEIGKIAAGDRISDFIGFLDGVGHNGRKILFEIPGAAAAGGSQRCHDIEQALDVAGGLDVAGRGHGAPAES